VRAVILQPNYVPWRGYFDLIREADVFVFYDDVQYDARGWRNRNRIKTAGGTRWLTIPVAHHGVQANETPISRIEMVENDWPRRHFAMITQAYARAPFLGRWRNWLQDTYQDPGRNLADFTIRTTIELAHLLGFRTTHFLRSSQLRVAGRKTERLVAVLKEIGATSYLTGPAAASYIEPELFEVAGIALEWKSYSYPPYPQLHGPFDPFVSVLDLLLMTGDDAARYIVP